MSLYALAGIAAGVVIVITLAAYFMFFRVGKTEGTATAEADTAKADLQGLKKADDIVMQETTHEDLQKSLRDGTF